MKRLRQEAEEKQLLALRTKNFSDASGNILLSQDVLLGVSLLVLIASICFHTWISRGTATFAGIAQIFQAAVYGNFQPGVPASLGFDQRRKSVADQSNCAGFCRLDEGGGDGSRTSFWQTAWWPRQSEVQERFKSALAEAAQGNIQRFEMEAAQANGQPCCTRFLPQTLLGEKGEVIFIIAEGRDITASKVAQGRFERESDSPASNYPEFG